MGVRAFFWIHRTCSCLFVCVRAEVTVCRNHFVSQQQVALQVSTVSTDGKTPVAISHVFHSQSIYDSCVFVSLVSPLPFLLSLYLSVPGSFAQLYPNPVSFRIPSLAASRPWTLSPSVPGGV